MTFLINHTYRGADGNYWKIVDRVNHVMLVEKKTTKNGIEIVVALAEDVDSLKAKVRMPNGFTTLYAEETE